MNNDTILANLRMLGLPTEEGKLYVELLKEPSTHLRLAHATGINRTKVYRLIDDLEKRSLVTRRTDDRGTFLTAADPSTLEVVLVSQEEKIKQQRQALDVVAPMLGQLQTGKTKDFAIQTYEGVAGFKQMLWHELRTAKGVVCIFGSSDLQDLVDDVEWAERHRAMTIEAGYSIQELVNEGDLGDFTNNADFMKRYNRRVIPESIVKLCDCFCIYNDTVAMYHWRQEEKVGFEIIDTNYVQMMRQIFEHYWQLAE